MILTELVRESFILILFCSLLPLLVCTGMSLVVSIVQALTQIQEQSMNFLVKFFFLALIIWLASDIFVSTISQFIEKCMQGIFYLGQLA